MGERTKRVLATLHHRLQAIGRFVGQLTIMALAAVLCFVPIFALLMASFYIANGVATLIGGGMVVMFIVFWVVIVLMGFYVSPHVQPRIGDALRALLKLDENTAA